MSPVEMPVEQLVKHVHQLDRCGCIDELTHFAEIPLDFDEPFLSQLSIERLRHILVAACLTAQSRRRSA